ncbi:permease-like cell division protein FtsX [Vagococcus entomophilus]|uniref:Cell division protein FtsX n=1 Tax=Vagococcus entomophilus TaxID=1160095 RepID=A0A430AIV0_9ENTE|nr:permease-like cell division protein FtsX [Vagococcus entomophilus]RSU07914.1 cell division protein FtsX [Vagococcus entomophilus]
MIRRMFRHLLESFKSLKRNGWMTIASVSAVTVTLVLVGAFLSLILNVTKVAQDVEKNVNVSVFVHIGTSKKDMKTLESQLEKISNVKNVKYSSSEDQYKKLVKSLGNSWKLFDGDNNPLYDVYILSVKTPDETKSVQQAAQKLDNVFKADYGGLSSDKILKMSDSIKKWGTGATILLLFVAIFLISNTIRITIISRKREIQIMRLVGAKNGYIRWPFFLEGAWIGVLGAVVPILLMSFGYTKAFLIINKSLITSNYSLIAPNELIFKVNLLMLAIGVVIGSLGSILSMRRFLRT